MYFSLNPLILHKTIHMMPLMAWPINVLLFLKFIHSLFLYPVEVFVMDKYALCAFFMQQKLHCELTGQWVDLVILLFFQAYPWIMS